MKALHQPSLWLELLGAETRFYDAGGIRTRSLEAGAGPALILLHGVGGCAESYARNVVPLGRDFRTYAIDYVGHGLSDGTDEPLTRQRYVQHIKDFMDAAGIEKAHIVGESLGGWIGAWMCLTYPERVERLVYCVGAHLDVPVDEAAAKKTAEGRGLLVKLSKAARENPTRETIRKRLEWLFWDVEANVTEELVDLRWALFQHRLTLGKALPTPGATAEDALTPERLGQIRQRTLVLWTDHNPSVGVPEGRKACDYLPNCEFALMEGCGHWPQWEDTPTFNRIVTAFLGA